MGSQGVGNDLVTDWTASCQSFADGTLGDVACALWTYTLRTPESSCLLLQPEGTVCAFTHLGDCDMWSSSVSQLPTVLWLLFSTPSPLFLGGFLHELPRTLSSDCLVISLSDCSFSFCWVWRLSFVVLDFLLSSESHAGRVTCCGASLLLCCPEGWDSGWGPSQCRWCRTTDSAWAEPHLQKVMAFLSWPTSHF